MNWGPGDFLFAAALAAAAVGAFAGARSRSASRAYRAGAGVALATAFLLVWANLAVGVIGSEDHPANLMFHGVVALGIAGAVLARLRPAGMARALLATALAQLLAAGIAQVAGWPVPWLPVLAFTALWLGAAWLFRVAACEGP